MQRFVLIESFPGNHVPYAATRIFHITFPARDEVYMAVTHRLTGDCSHIDTNVEACNGLVPRQQHGASLVQQRVTGRPFVIVEIEVGFDVSAGDDKCVQRRHRGGVEDGYGHRVLTYNTLRPEGAEDTRVLCRVHRIHDTTVSDY